MVHIWAYGHNNLNIQLYFYKMKILYVARFSVLPSISEVEPVNLCILKFKRFKVKYDGHENIMVHIWTCGHND